MGSRDREPEPEMEIISETDIPWWNNPERSGPQAYQSFCISYELVRRHLSSTIHPIISMISKISLLHQRFLTVSKDSSLSSHISQSPNDLLVSVYKAVKSIWYFNLPAEFLH